MKSERLSFSQAIFLSISSIIGGGIFLKAKTLNQLSNQQKTPLIFLFLISTIAIICLTYALIKIIPIQRTNAGFIEWTQKLTPRWFHRMSVNFVRNIYHPISLFLFSNYAISNFSGNVYLNTWSKLLFGFIVCSIFMVLHLISFNKSWKVHMFLITMTFIPLLVLPTIGFFQPGSGEISGTNGAGAPKIVDRSPWWVLVFGLPSIFFIFDGFYGLSAIKNKLEKPEYLTRCLVISFIVVTILYLYLIIGFNMGDPKTADYKNFELFKDHTQFSIFFEICIGCASLLTLNSIIFGNIYQLSAINKIYKFKDIEWIKKNIFYKNVDLSRKEFHEYFVSWFYLNIKTFIVFLLAGIASQIASIFKDFTFINDILDSWADIVSVMVFLIIAGVIFSSIEKLRLKKNKDYLFKYSAIISSSLIIISMGYLMISYMVEIFYTSSEKNASAIFKLSSLIFFFLIISCDQIYKFIKKWRFRREYNLLSANMKDSIITLE